MPFEAIAQLGKDLASRLSTRADAKYKIDLAEQASREAETANDFGRDLLDFDANSREAESTSALRAAEMLSSAGSTIVDNEGTESVISREAAESGAIKVGDEALNQVSDGYRALRERFEKLPPKVQKQYFEDMEARGKGLGNLAEKQTKRKAKFVEEQNKRLRNSGINRFDTLSPSARPQLWAPANVDQRESAIEGLVRRRVAAGADPDETLKEADEFRSEGYKEVLSEDFHRADDRGKQALIREMLTGDNPIPRDGRNAFAELLRKEEKSMLIGDPDRAAELRGAVDLKTEVLGEGEELGILGLLYEENSDIDLRDARVTLNNMRRYSGVKDDTGKAIISDALVTDMEGAIAFREKLNKGEAADEVGVSHPDVNLAVRNAVSTALESGPLSLPKAYEVAKLAADKAGYKLGATGFTSFYREITSTADGVNRLKNATRALRLPLRVLFEQKTLSFSGTNSLGTDQKAQVQAAFDQVLSGDLSIPGTTYTLPELESALIDGRAESVTVDGEKYGLGEEEKMVKAVMKSFAADLLLRLNGAEGGDVEEAQRRVRALISLAKKAATPEYDSPSSEARERFVGRLRARGFKTDGKNDWDRFRRILIDTGRLYEGVVPQDAWSAPKIEITPTKE